MKVRGLSGPEEVAQVAQVARQQRAACPVLAAPCGGRLRHAERTGGAEPGLGRGGGRRRRGSGPAQPLGRDECRVRFLVFWEAF